MLRRNRQQYNMIPIRTTLRANNSNFNNIKHPVVIHTHGRDFNKCVIARKAGNTSSIYIIISSTRPGFRNESLTGWIIGRASWARDTTFMANFKSKFVATGIQARYVHARIYAVYTVNKHRTSEIKQSGISCALSPDPLFFPVSGDARLCEIAALESAGKKVSLLFLSGSLHMQHAGI